MGITGRMPGASSWSAKRRKWAFGVECAQAPRWGARRRTPAAPSRCTPRLSSVAAVAQVWRQRLSINFGYTTELALSNQPPTRNRHEGAAARLASPATHSTAEIGQFPLSGNARCQKHLRGQYLGAAALAPDLNGFGRSKVRDRCCVDRYVSRLLCSTPRLCGADACASFARRRVYFPPYPAGDFRHQDNRKPGICGSPRLSAVRDHQTRHNRGQTESEGKVMTDHCAHGRSPSISPGRRSSRYRAALFSNFSWPADRLCERWRARTGGRQADQGPS